MAGSPKLKIYTASGRYVASLKEYEAAAALASFYGNGATVRYGHGGLVLWTEGTDGEGAESFDGATAVMIERLRQG